MDRKRALEILGLTDEATPDEISNRVGILLKKFKQMSKDDQGNTLADIEAAYKSLSGIDYRDEEAEKKKHYRKTHPNALFKLLRMDEEKARNLIYYYKWHVVIGIAAIALVISMVVSIVNNVEPDLKIIVSGDIYLAQSDSLEERIENEIGAAEVLIQNIYLSAKSDPQSQMMMQQKYVVEIAAGENDLFILDEIKYQELAKQGALKPMEPFIEEYGITGNIETDIEGLKVAMEADDENTYEPKLYGLDVSESTWLREAGMVGERFIIAFGISGNKTQNAQVLVKKLLEKK